MASESSKVPVHLPKHAGGIFSQVLLGCYTPRQIELNRTRERQRETRIWAACIKGISENRRSHQGIQRFSFLLSRLRHHKTT
ncbi:MAG: hypothetical protein OJF50_004455 [Nitrospira sp.]|nr:hypothetical protein [Nitrospira sp.]